MSLFEAEMYGSKDKKRLRLLMQKEAVYGCRFKQTVQLLIGSP